MKIRLVYIGLVLGVLGCVYMQAAEFPEGRPAPSVAVAAGHPEREDVVAIVFAPGKDEDIHGENKLIAGKLSEAKESFNAALNINIKNDIKCCDTIARLRTELDAEIDGRAIIDSVKQRRCKVMFIVKGDNQATSILQLLRGDTVQGFSFHGLFGDVADPIHSVILFDPTVAEGKLRHAIIPNYAYIAHKIYNFYSQIGFAQYRTLHPAAQDQPVDVNFIFKVANLCCKVIDAKGLLSDLKLSSIDDIDFTIIARALRLADGFNLHATFNVLLDDKRAYVAGASGRVCPVPLVWIRAGYDVEIQDFAKAKLSEPTSKQLNYRIKTLVARSGVQRGLKAAEKMVRRLPVAGYFGGVLMQGTEVVNRQAGAADEFYTSQPITNIAVYQSLARFC
jgi:hypothetical protein